MKESDIQKAILNYLRDIKKYTVWRSYVGPVIHKSRVFTKNTEMAGYPDITGFLNNFPKQMFCIEVKSKKGVVSPDQKKWHALLKRHEIPVMVVRSLQDTIDSLDILEEYGYPLPDNE